MRNSIFALLSALLFTLFGCNSAPAPPFPPTVNDFVRNDPTGGTAKVFGINFQVETTSNGASTEFDFHANFADPSQSRAKIRFTFGDDVNVLLESIDQTKVRFQFNDRDFGTLNVGDEVTINEQRAVEVNGVIRSPESVN